MAEAKIPVNYLQVTLVRALAQLFLVVELFLDGRFLVQYCVYKFIFNLNYTLLYVEQQIFLRRFR